VPRYYFHFSDGERQFSDDSGIDLAGLRAARAHATAQVRELKAAMCDRTIRDFGGWSMTVTDARDRTVFVLGFDLKPRAPAPDAPRRSSKAAAPAPPGSARAGAADARASRSGAIAKD
jgi:hypothetical protein